MKALLRWICLVLLALLALQLFFVARIAAMVAVDPESTSFQRSEAWALATGSPPPALAAAVGAGHADRRCAQARRDRLRG